MNKTTEPLSYFGAFTTFIAGWGLTLSDFATICGILFGLFTLLLNWYYKQKEIELRQLEIEKGLKNEKKTH